MVSQENLFDIYATCWEGALEKLSVQVAGLKETCREYNVCVQFCVAWRWAEESEAPFKKQNNSGKGQAAGALNDLQNSAMQAKAEKMMGYYC